MINSIKDFMATCPFLTETDININYLGEDAVSSSVNSVSADPVIKTYTDGGSLRQFIFEISIRQSYGENEEANIAAAELLENISDWIEQKNNVGILPSLSNNKHPISLEIFRTGRVKHKTADTAKYQLKCKLIYYQE